MIIYTDGGSRGNPGPGGAGFTLADDNGDSELAGTRDIYLGQTTNNIAEYYGHQRGAEGCRAEMGAESISLFSDSRIAGAAVEWPIQGQE